MTQWSGGRDAFIADRQPSKMRNETFYDEGIRQLMHRWDKCVALQGAHVEKDQLT
jgi:hypothetical protein